MTSNSIQKRIVEAKERRSPLVNLSETGLTQLPDELYDMPWVTSLFASFNTISDLTPLGSLPNLKRLDLRGNRVADVAPISQLTELEYLDIAENQLRDLIPLHLLIASVNSLPLEIASRRLDRLDQCGN